MGESRTNLGFLGYKKAKIPKLDEKPPQDLGKKSQALETLVWTNSFLFGIRSIYVLISMVLCLLQLNCEATEAEGFV